MINDLPTQLCIAQNTKTIRNLLNELHPNALLDNTGEAGILQKRVEESKVLVSNQ
jgi:hypothetical protein